MARHMRRLAVATGLVALVLGLGGCVRPHAQTEPAMPPLATPPPPPHQVVPAPAPAEAPAGTPASPAHPPERRRRPARAEPPHPGAPASGTPTTTAAPPAPTLETAPAADAGAEAQDIRETLGKASRDLAGVDYQSLSDNARAQYDTAKRFIRQAEDALKSRNFVFARSLADKAAVLATLLRGGF
ncbi:MAG TPA: hypothetical protein VNE16_00855 [Vicinamibacterales bacterium]|nr:hypothetical protein [Vicinamibacterales bacterium]